MSEKILVTRSSMPSFEEYCAEIRPLWDSRWLTNMGVKHDEFQERLRRFLGCPHVALFTNGHLALELFLSAMRFPRGAEIITTPFTFASTIHAIVRNGLVPVFADIRPDTYTLDPALVEPLVTPKTAAILPVHVYGHVCDVEAFDAIAGRHRLLVVYDAAHAFGVRYKGLSPAVLGDAAMFSFHATKVFHTIEGGALCFKHPGWVRPLDDMKNFGIRDEDTVAIPGGNAKMSEFQAAMGLCNLRHIDGEIAKRKSVVERYRRRLAGVPGLRLPPVQPRVESNYAYFPVLFDGPVSRDRMRSVLAGHGIFARKYFYPLATRYDCYASLPSAPTPVAERVAQSVLTLPLFADLAPGEVDRICDVILGEFARATS